uniref:protein SODIUM POTASSIUM ROOT DEFECTIVE 2 n=1 Tax=Erigeron canadensis TaxID=72917 RepID=UPI001CB95D61|nr:protein SODIUM POTASSIUM ROOT DEFECTIVE 2 [Erigeron canadensis]
MKTIDIFCASQAAITTMNNSDIDHHHPSSPNNNGGRAIDRHNPIIQDEKRLTKTLPIIPPTSNTHNNKNKNKTRQLKENKQDQKCKNITFADENSDQQVIINKNSHVVKKPGSVLLGWGCTRPGDFISPATSSRFLLADKALSDQFDPLLVKQVSNSPALPQPLPQKIEIYDGEKSFRKKDDGNIPATSSPSPVKSLPRSSSSISSDQQVVVLRVSLHCKGCEKKMRKHISKMEGVTSFNIDFMAKKVTVVGNITPLAVLASISKVKNAKLLTPTTISSSTVPHMDSSFSEIKKQLGLIA